MCQPGPVATTAAAAAAAAASCGSQGLGLRV